MVSGSNGSVSSVTARGLRLRSGSAPSWQRRCLRGRREWLRCRVSMRWRVDVLLSRGSLAGSLEFELEIHFGGGSLPLGTRAQAWECWGHRLNPQSWRRSRGHSSLLFVGDPAAVQETVQVLDDAARASDVIVLLLAGGVALSFERPGQTDWLPIAHWS